METIMTRNIDSLKKLSCVFLFLFFLSIRSDLTKTRIVMSQADDITTSISWSPDGELYATGNFDGNVYIFTKDGQLIKTLQGHTDIVTTVAWNPNINSSLLATSGLDKTILIWDPLSGNLLETLSTHKDGILSLTWTPDGTQLASGTIRENGNLRIWSISTWTSEQFTVGSIYHAAWSPDGTHLAIANSGGQLEIRTGWNGKGFPQNVYMQE